MSPFGRSDSPPPSWYEPIDIEEDDVEHEPAEDLAVISGLVCWSAAPVLDDD